MPIRHNFRPDTAKSSSNHGAQDVFRRGGLIQSVLDGFDVGRSRGFLQDLSVQSQLVAEMIVYGGDICSRPQTNFANRGGLIPAIGKNPPGNLQQLFSCWV